jgi:hypothetical protein
VPYRGYEYAENHWALASGAVKLSKPRLATATTLNSKKDRMVILPEKKAGELIHRAVRTHYIFMSKSNAKRCVGPS